jgi:hypothetical protein
MKTKAERIAAMIADEKSPFTAAEQAQLESMTEEQLDALTSQTREQRMAAVFASVKPVEKIEEPKVEVVEEKPAVVVAEAKPVVTTNECPKCLAASNARHAASIAVIKGNKRNKFTDEQLKAKTQEDLDAIIELTGAEVKMAAAVDFSGMGTPRVETDRQAAPPAPDFAAALKARNAAKK